MQTENVPNQGAEGQAPQPNPEEQKIRKEEPEQAESSMPQYSPENKKRLTGDQMLRSLILHGMNVKNADKISQKIDEIVELLEEE